MKLEFYKSSIRLHHKEYIVLTPIQNFEKLFCCTENLDYLILFGDIQSYSYLSYIFALINQEKQVIIYLPLRKHGLTEYLAISQGVNSAKDIVILNHSIQFNVKEWKVIRQLLDQKEKCTYSFEDDIFPKINTDYRELYYRTNKDLLDIKNAYETIFFIGSPKIYGSIANDCKEFAEGEPDAIFEEYKFYHAHRHLDIYLRRREEIYFSIDYYDKNLWGS